MVCLIDFSFIGYCLKLFGDKSIWLKVFVVGFLQSWLHRRYFISYFHFCIKRSSHRRCSIKSVLKNFANFTGKHLCWSLFLLKLQAYTYFEEHLRTAAPVSITNQYRHQYYRRRVSIVIMTVGLAKDFSKTILPVVLRKSLRFQRILVHCCISCRNQSSDLQSKSNDWFLFEIQHLAKIG